MRYATFTAPADTSPRLGVVLADRIVAAESLVAGGWPGHFPASLLELVRLGPDAWRRMADAGAAADIARMTSYGAADVRWHAPIPRPGKNVFCVGRNYAEHIAEGARARGEVAKIPAYPMFFTKSPNTINGPYDDIPWEPRVTQQVDWEAELGAIIGRGGRNIPRGAALDHVFGYTVINDVSARDVQKNHGQFFKGKSLDGYCPIGPVVVTADEFGDPQNKAVSCRVNSVLKQHGTTRDMIFPVNVIVEWLSLGLTLEGGDIIATGTPDGVGFGRTPPEFLGDGDVLETEVEGIGVLRNTIRRVDG
jgi:2-keto-4-pentenoate hydratase/2-oxohepta-3-ene-1,7-dioic acid hydratase in catechol pathway